MTAYQILLHELVAHGRTTYAELCNRYPAWGHKNFIQAVYRARKLGIVRTDGRKGVTIIAIGPCPCCGQALGAPPRHRIVELLIRALRLEARLQEVDHAEP